MADPDPPASLAARLARLPLAAIRALPVPVGPVRPGRGDGLPDLDPRDPDGATVLVQMRIARDALDCGKGSGGGFGATDDPGSDAGPYLFRPGRVLVRAEDVESLDAWFRRDKRFVGPGEAVELMDGLVTYVLPRLARGRRAPEVPQVLDELDRALGEGVARPDHILYVTGWGRLCPATEPEEVGDPTPVPPLADDPAVGDGYRVSVVDTGWWRPAGRSKVSSWLQGVHGDLEVVDPADIHPYAGHGTFVSGVIRCLAPAVAIEVEGLLPHGGVAYESDIARELGEALADAPHVVSISAGTYSRRDLGLLAFDVLADRRRLREPEAPSLVVAAAGNEGTDRPFFPAAYRWVVGVGALEEDGSPCEFTNHGPWVDVYARGRGLVNAFPRGTYTCHEPPNVPDVRHFDGIARWSGTSFATPVVTGSVIAHLSAHGGTAREAVDRLIQDGRTVQDPSGVDVAAVGPPFVQPVV